MSSRALSLLVLLVLLATALWYWQLRPTPVPAQWTAQQTALIRSLALDALPPLPPQPSNRVADSPAAAALGQRLFFDSRLSADGRVSCATCHQPVRYFTDGRKLAKGLATGSRHTPSLLGAAYSPWFYWDGRKDSQWAQALAPIEAPHEQGLPRTDVVSLISDDADYRAMYAEVFSAADLQVSLAEQDAAAKQEHSSVQTDRVFSNLGKALAAYQRTLLPQPSAFDDYAHSIADDGSSNKTLIGKAAVAGLSLFIGDAQCVNCHNGPLLSNFEFHNTGVLPPPGQLPGLGRYAGIREARRDPFNCLGAFSDTSSDTDSTASCAELRFARDGSDSSGNGDSTVGAHKTPGLRNVAETAPYMHGGQIDSLQEVMAHYNRPPVAMLAHNEAKPLGLRPRQLQELVAFLETLTQH